MQWSGGLFYRHLTPGPGAAPMVHVHGFGISGASLLPTATLLADEFDTYVPDLPGHGRSDGPRRPLDLIGHGDALARFCDHLGLEKATFVGNSMGCSVIYSLAHRHPDRVERAILVSPAGGDRSLGQAALQLGIDATREPPSLATVAVPDYVRFGAINSVRMFAAMARTDNVRMLRDLPVPKLYVLGRRDPLLPNPARIAMMAQAADVAGQTTGVWLAGAAHAINWSHPRQLAAIIRAYVADPSILDPATLPSGAEVVVAARR